MDELHYILCYLQVNSVHGIISAVLLQVVKLWLAYMLSLVKMTDANRLFMWPRSVAHDPAQLRGRGSESCQRIGELHPARARPYTSFELIIQRIFIFIKLRLIQCTTNVIIYRWNSPVGFGVVCILVQLFKGNFKYKCCCCRLPDSLENFKIQLSHVRGECLLFYKLNCV